MNSFIVYDGNLKDEYILDMYMQYILSEKFGWTPEQISTLTFEEFEYYFAFIKANNIKQENEYKKSLKNNR